jgi:chorismate mutase
MKNDIKHYRARIDDIDRQIVSLLHKRAENILNIGKIKNRTNGPAYDPAREAMILRKLKKGKFSADGLKAVYNEIFSVSRAMQRRAGVLIQNSKFKRQKSKARR